MADCLLAAVDAAAARETDAADQCDMRHEFFAVKRDPRPGGVSSP